MTPTNPFDDPKTAAHYEAWYETDGRWADAREKALLKWLLSHFPQAHSILDVGCGTGHFTRWFHVQSMEVIGLDMSDEMIKQAKSTGEEEFVLGNALHLPFGYQSFDLAALVTTLEFLPDAYQALAEALRVCKQGILLGVLNRESRLGRKYMRAGGHIWSHASLFTLYELEQILQEVSGGNIRTVWRTTLWPLWPGSLPLPGGGFIGMGVIKLQNREENNG